MKNKKHVDYFDIEPKAKNILGAWLLTLFIEGGWFLLLYLIFKVFK